MYTSASFNNVKLALMTPYGCFNYPVVLYVDLWKFNGKHTSYPIINFFSTLEQQVL